MEEIRAISISEEGKKDMIEVGISPKVLCSEMLKDSNSMTEIKDGDGFVYFGDYVITGIKKRSVAIIKSVINVSNTLFTKI